MDRYTADNLANWNDRVPIHVSSDLYQIDELASDPDHLSSVVVFDRDYLGDVSGKTLLHTQCHFGNDTLSWAKLGATVTGIDFSAPALDVARDTATRLGVDARFVVSELYASPDLVNETFDFVYTGVGAICWLPDIARWAETMAAFTRPGGTFYMREGHPLMWALDYEREDDLISITEHYFERETPSTWHEAETYAGEGTLEHHTIHSWNHGLGEIFTALIKAGFVIDLFEEHRFLDWQALPHMVEVDGVWLLPKNQRDLVPLMYSLRATRT
jgi:SAM-dependent methyltransferase